MARVHGEGRIRGYPFRKRQDGFTSFSSDEELGIIPAEVCTSS